MHCVSSADSRKKRRRSEENDGGKEARSNERPSTCLDANCNDFGKDIEVIPLKCEQSCLVKMYDLDGEVFKLNDIVEVAG